MIQSIWISQNSLSPSFKTKYLITGKTVNNFNLFSTHGRVLDPHPRTLSLSHGRIDWQYRSWDNLCIWGVTWQVDRKKPPPLGGVSCWVGSKPRIRRKRTPNVGGRDWSQDHAQVLTNGHLTSCVLGTSRIRLVKFRLSPNVLLFNLGNLYGPGCPPGRDTLTVGNCRPPHPVTQQKPQPEAEVLLRKMVCVLLRFINPILMNCYGPGVSSCQQTSDNPVGWPSPRPSP